MSVRCATINLKQTHNRRIALQRAGWVATFLRLHRIEAAMLQECTDELAAALEQLPGWRLLRKSNKWGQGDCPILIRKNVPIKRWATRKMGRRWTWKKLHAPRYLTWVQLEDGTTLGSIHTPPGVDIKGHGFKGVIGRRSLKRGWIAYMKNLIRFAEKRDKYCLAGDWNEGPQNDGTLSPASVAKYLGATLRHRGHIEYAMAKGVEVSRLGRHPSGPGMDHEIFVYTVRAV